MATSATSRIGLLRPLPGGHQFSLDEYADNLTLLDTLPGVYLCESSSRPLTWTAANEGQFIFETNTNLLWRWDGTQFMRVGPSGLLGTADLAVDFSTASTSAQTALTAVVDVPATSPGSTAKRVRVSASWYALDNGTDTTYGACQVSLRRDPGDVLLRRKLWIGRPDSATDPLDWGGGGDIEAFDAPAAGSTTYRLCINSLASVGGTSTLRADATDLAFIQVEEVGT